MGQKSWYKPVEFGVSSQPYGAHVGFYDLAGKHEPDETR